MRRARDPWRGAWEVPGGFCEEAEHPALAAQRELREELGVEGRVVAYIGSWIDVYGTAQDNQATSTPSTARICRARGARLPARPPGRGGA